MQLHSEEKPPFEQIQVLGTLKRFGGGGLRFSTRKEMFFVFSFRKKNSWKGVKVVKILLISKEGYLMIQFYDVFHCSFRLYGAKPGKSPDSPQLFVFLGIDIDPCVSVSMCKTVSNITYDLLGFLQEAAHSLHMAVKAAEAGEPWATVGSPWTYFWMRLLVCFDSGGLCVLS